MLNLSNLRFRSKKKLQRSMLLIRCGEHSANLSHGGVKRELFHSFAVFSDTVK